MHFADRLLAAIDAKGVAACVGLDPVIDRLPQSIRRAHGLDPVRSALTPDDAVPSVPRRACAEAIADFCGQVMEVVAPLVPAVKINIAFFERYGAAGVAAYERLVAQGRRIGLIVIGDVKRADIGNTSEQYAHAHLGPTDAGVGPDAITVNPYFGFDSVSPFITTARAQQAGLFVLVQTSNPSAHEVQGMPLAGGDMVCHRVARLVEQWATASELLGERGFSDVGAVVSPRDLASTDIIRGLMPHCIFLVPGFGAQGRTADEVAHCFDADGRGALVTASRSVIYPFQETRSSESTGADWRSAVRDACQEFTGQVAALCAHRP